MTNAAKGPHFAPPKTDAQKYGPPEEGRADTISAIAKPTNIVIMATSTHPQIADTGPPLEYAIPKEPACNGSMHADTCCYRTSVALCNQCCAHLPCTTTIVKSYHCVYLCWACSSHVHAAQDGHMATKIVLGCVLKSGPSLLLSFAMHSCVIVQLGAMLSVHRMMPLEWTQSHQCW